MSIRARWTIGLLLALVIGLGVGFAIVAGDNGSDEGPGTVDVIETEQPATTEEQASETESVPDAGGVAPPTETGKPDASGGLGY